MASLRSTTSIPANSTRSSTNGDFTTALYAFLNALPKLTLARLYKTPASCLAIFRLLPLIARHLVLNLIWSDQPILKSDVLLWSQSKTQLQESLTKLTRLNIIEESSTSDGRTKLTLNSSFQVNFRRALTGGGNHCSFGVPCNTPINSIVSIDELDKYGTEKWETILHYMVGRMLPTKPSHNILSLLNQSGLMISSSSDSSSLKITSNGFGFLLEDVNTQLWDILLQYLKMTEANGVDVVDVLACLFMLGSLELGQEYSFSNWTQTQTQVLQDLVDYGLVLVTAPDRFYPTRLATTLTSSAPPLVSAERAQEEDGFLVLETNYRVYAYTSNPLQIAVLNLFLSLRYRFPNLVVGAVTRESIKSALSNGITADQSSIKSDCGNSKKTEFEPKKGSCMKTLNRRRNSTELHIDRMDHQPDHPVRRLIDNNNNNIAILSPLVQLSFVFHLAIAHLQKHSHNHPHSLVTVIIGSSTQASFQKALVDENDAFLMKASSDNSALSNLLERIEFRTSLSRTNWSGPSQAYQISLGCLDLSALSNCNSLQSINFNHPPPIYLLDRIEPTQKWPFSATRSASIERSIRDHHHLRGLLEIFQHFFRRTWMIESLESSSGPQSKRDDNNSNTLNEPGRRMRMYSHRSRSKISTDNETDDHCHQDQIIYQVLDDLQDQNGQYSNSINPTGLLRRTVVV
ncbi:hypothetical protein PSHT_03769 [Puccinia striiformis]|uniref:RNA polymerase II transcription factor B subunit 2 n=1 Tax=Puccinia striiformis TaxID=27350 RepID=A0A2S4WEP5_9BASI|nr:hypothetical protein PSHT_03769 [Puccinia striiformis]